MQKPRLIAGLVGLAFLLFAGIAWAAPPPGGTFTDDDGNTFEGAIETIAAEGITRGCNPPANTRFCPDDHVTRGQMAIFIVRAYQLTGDPALDFFTDDTGKVYEHAANLLLLNRLTQGCGPRLFCGDDTMTRGEMARFMSRAENLPDSTTDHFVDDNSSIFEPGINKLADARITFGCNPPTNTNFCPGDHVTRAQMAGFLTRGLETPNCDPSYPDFCIPPPPPDLDCGHVDPFNFSFRVLPPDPHGFDVDQDGIGCEFDPPADSGPPQDQPPL